MSQFTWSFDAPSGVFKSHAMSEQLRYAAIAETKGMQFVTTEPGYGKKRGESVTISRISRLAIPTTGQLLETVQIPEDVLTLTTVSITVAEWGRSVPYTSLSTDLNEFNMESIVQRALRDQMKIILDNACFTAFKTAKIKMTMTGVASVNFDTNGTVSQTAAANFNVYGVEQARDYLYTTLQTPPFEGDDYIGLVSTKAKRGVMSDPAWEPWHRYTDPEAKYNSEIGRLENVRFIEINNTGALSANPGASQTVQGEGLIFGADAVAVAVAEDPELRARMPTDYGRSRGVAWYGVLNFGLVWDTANAGEARVLHVTSA
jgi:N4-gp56 family major capsid protein